MNGDVDLLSFSQHRQSPAAAARGVERLPSWVPDWSKPIVRPSGQLPWETAFVACGNECFEKAVTIQSHVNSPLELYGWTIDSIEAVAPAWLNPDGKSRENEYNTTRFLTDIEGFCEASDHKFSCAPRDIYSQTADRESAHFLVPVADQELSSARATRRAGEVSREGYPAVVDRSLISAALEKEYELGTELSLKAACYVQAMKHQKFRRPFLSFAGYVGLAPQAANWGDVLVIFRGAKFPYVLRHAGEGTYNLVGDAYVHGMMYGEYVKTPREVERFVLQ